MVVPACFAAVALVAATLSSACSAEPQAPSATYAAAPASEIAATHMTVPAPDGRSIDVTVWTAPDEKGVVVYSHGFNGSPAAYHRILSDWAAEGFTVVAPLHVDSLQHPEHDKYDSRQAFSTRLTDLAVMRGFLRAAHAGKPMIAAGHSFGSLMSMIAGGAVTAAGPLGDPDIKGVIAFSTAGDVPGLVTPTTWGGLSTPLLLVTGNRDVVDGYVADPTDHRHGYDHSPAGDKMLMTFADGDHELIARADPADFTLIAMATEAFLDAYALNDAAAKTRLANLAAPEGVVIERR